MSNFRVTERSVATRVLVGLNNAQNRLGDTQSKLASGKQLTRPSDSPTGAVSAMQYRGEVSVNSQYQRNANDGLGWLGVADQALTSMNGQVNRVRELVLQGMSTGAGTEGAREAVAAELTALRDSLINVANSRYLDRPVFGGTTPGDYAFDPATGAYLGDDGSVQRSVGDATKVRVDTPAAQVFGTGSNQLFTVLKDLADHMRNDPSQLQADLARLDSATRTLQSGMSGVGARYNQVERMSNAAENRVAELGHQLSEVEDVDITRSLIDLSLQQTAYQAALAAGAKVVQPSLVDFLR